MWPAPSNGLANGSSHHALELQGRQAATQALFGGAAAAEFNLPFLLSIDPQAADQPQAQTVFADLLTELWQEPTQGPDPQVPLLKVEAPNSMEMPEGILDGLQAATQQTLVGGLEQLGLPDAGKAGPIPAPTTPGSGNVAAAQPGGTQPVSPLALPPQLSGTAGWSGPLPHNTALEQHACTAPAPQPVQQPEVCAATDGSEGAHGGNKRRAARHLSASEGSEGNSKGGAGKRPDAVARRAAVQKRYREKKDAAMRVLFEQAEKQAAHLAALEQEHAVLMGKQHTLQKLVMCRDEQLLVLARVRGMCRAPGLQDSLQAQLGGCWGPDCAAAAPANQEELCQYKLMTSEQLRSMWLQFVQQASQLLTQMGQPGASPATASSLEALVSGVGRTMKHAVQLNCPIVYMLMQINLETGVPGMAPDAHWRHVVSLLQLTPAQSLEAQCMFELYCQLMTKVLEERAMLKAGLASAAHGPSSLGGTGTPTCAHGDASVPAFLLPPGPACMDEMGCAEQLYLNLHKERSTRCLLCCFFFGKLLTPLQLARFAVASYPHFPDPLSVSRVLAGTPPCPAPPREPIADAQ